MTSIALKLTRRVLIMAGISAMTAAPAMACRSTKPYDAQAADFVFIGRAIDIDVQYNDVQYIDINVQYNHAPKTWKTKRYATSSTVTFEIIEVLKGDYDGQTIDAQFGFNWFGGPETKLRDLQRGEDKQAMVGVRLGTGTLMPTQVIGGICSADYFIPKPKPDSPGAKYWGTADMPGLPF